MTRVDKLAQLVAVFDQFHASISALEDSGAKRLVGGWTAIRHQYVRPNDVSRSALAGGMEQGLREIPMVLESLSPEARTAAAAALEAAVATHYPRFLAEDAARLEKVLARGSIRGENEYYVVRHWIDVIEGEPGREKELECLYQLVGRFESRR